MSTPTIRLIITREITDRLRNRLYVVGTLVIAAAVVGAVALPGLLDDREAQRYDLGVVGSLPAGFEDTLAAAAAAQDFDVELIRLAPLETATAVTEGDVHAALVDATELVVGGAPPIELRTTVEAALQQAQTALALEAAGLADEQIAVALAPAQPLAVVDPAGADGADWFTTWMVAFGATALLIGAVMSNASSLLSGTVEEKSSRVVEVLLATVRPWQLLAGKITALTALALAQLGIVVGAALGANALVGTLDLPPATTATVAATIGMLLLGFTFYAALYAAAGSLAATTGDAQGSAGPLGFLVMAAYFGVIFAVLPDPQGLWAQALTYLPPTAPFTVPARVAFDAIPAWQVAASAGITLLTVVATVALAARLYSASLLAGGKLTWRQAWQSEPVT